MGPAGIGSDQSAATPPPACDPGFTPCTLFTAVMDLIRLLRSLEEFLYELVGWLVFYPRMFWRVLIHPGEVARYTRRELGKDPDQRFSDAISPVLMLILSVAIAHALEMAMRMSSPRLSTPVGQLLFSSEQGLLLTRSAVFCVYALGAALGTLRRQRLPVNRETLREPFSIQAFIACPFVVVLALSQAAAASPAQAGPFTAASISALAVAWYLWARMRAFVAVNGGSALRAFGSVVVSFLLTTIGIVGLFAAVII
ncbi:YIP1 family protein [Stenotrophomonas indicatrix]|uniref:YIP1 family protein n=1 Tax=Stenotrophomonas indicatrix TaxID=2045451 RepID=UPI000AC21D23|nr:YIP1 family protein [Stenotrophomonas indicatrix]MCR8713095.1 YIP1 family protein [Stenotrophomonas indicatrix]